MHNWYSDNPDQTFINIGSRKVPASRSYIKSLQFNQCVLQGIPGDGCPQEVNIHVECYFGHIGVRVAVLTAVLSSYLHENDIVHGNLSLASIFIQHDGLIKIGSGI